MVLKVTQKVSEADKHSADVTILFSRNGKLYSGANDGKIKVKNKTLLILKFYFIYLLSACLSSSECIKYGPILNNFLYNFLNFCHINFSNIIWIWQWIFFRLNYLFLLKLSIKYLTFQREAVEV